MINQLACSIRALLSQLNDVLMELSDEQYAARIPMLSNASIGQHTRHLIEFYTELQESYESGVLSYDDRKRDYLIETCRTTAINNLSRLNTLFYNEDRSLTIHADFSLEKNEAKFRLSTTYTRELLYNLEHTVHHMALIRVGVMASTELGLPDDFGVAVSTLKFREKQCAQ